jgi:hypothetical protein
MTFPLPDDAQCTGVTSIDDGITRHETECPVHPATDELPEWIGDDPHVDDGPGAYCPHGDYSGRYFPVIER